MRTEGEIRQRLDLQRAFLAAFRQRTEQTPAVIACLDITRFVIAELQWVLREGGDDGAHDER